jgi:ribosome-interacting GTPase 1
LQLKNISEEELTLLESKLSEKSIQILLQKETVKLEKEMKEGLEVCRICSLKIRLDEIQKHVKVCQRRGCLKQELL